MWKWDITAPEGDLIMEWLTTNWIWLAVGLGIAWFFFRVLLGETVA